MEKIENRREFVISTARYSLLTILGLGAGRIILQSVQSDCPTNTLCAHCKELDQCEQPKAVAIKLSTLQEVQEHVR